MKKYWFDSDDLSHLVSHAYKSGQSSKMEGKMDSKTDKTEHLMRNAESRAKRQKSRRAHLRQLQRVLEIYQNNLRYAYKREEEVKQRAYKTLKELDECKAKLREYEAKANKKWWEVFCK